MKDGTFWICLDGENAKGPYSTEQLQAMLDEGQIEHETPITPNGSDEWNRVGKFIQRSPSRFPKNESGHTPRCMVCKSPDLTWQKVDRFGGVVCAIATIFLLLGILELCVIAFIVVASLLNGDVATFAGTLLMSIPFVLPGIIMIGIAWFFMQSKTEIRCSHCGYTAPAS